MTGRILIIDDDQRLAAMVSDYLGTAGFRVAAAPTAREGEQRLKREPFDALVLDLMLPDGDGLEVCRRIRQHSDVPQSKANIGSSVMGMSDCRPY